MSQAVPDDAAPPAPPDRGGRGAVAAPRLLARLLAFVAGVAVLVGGSGGFGSGTLGLPLTLAFAAPWLVGGALLRTRPRTGTVVLVVSSLVALQGMLPALADILSDPWLAPGGTWRALLGQAPYLPMLAAGVAAWMGRPSGGWAGGPRVPRLVALPLALSFLPAVMPEILVTWPHRPGTPANGWFATYLGQTELVTPGLLARLLVAAGVAILLIWVVTSLRRGLAAVVVLTVGIPQAVGLMASLVQAWQHPTLIVAPAGYVTVTAVGALVVLGLRWLVQDPSVER